MAGRWSGSQGRKPSPDVLDRRRRQPGDEPGGAGAHRRRQVEVDGAIKPAALARGPDDDRAVRGRLHHRRDLPVPVAGGDAEQVVAVDELVAQEPLVGGGEPHAGRWPLRGATGSDTADCASGALHGPAASTTVSAASSSPATRTPATRPRCTQISSTRASVRMAAPSSPAWRASPRAMARGSHCLGRRESARRHGPDRSARARARAAHRRRPNGLAPRRRPGGPPGPARPPGPGVRVHDQRSLAADPGRRAQALAELAVERQSRDRQLPAPGRRPCRRTARCPPPARSCRRRRRPGRPASPRGRAAPARTRSRRRRSRRRR